MLFAHSLAEARLYLTLNPCTKCRDESSDEPLPSRLPIRVKTTIERVSKSCVACGKMQQVEFAILEGGAVDGQHSPINPTNESSRIIDVGQWLTLARVFTEKSRSEPDRVAARLLALQAAECLREALKFYDDPDNDLPPADSLFTESSRRRFREAPQQFSRQRILGEIQKLPVTAQ